MRSARGLARRCGTEEVVDEAGFADRVLAHEQHEGLGSCERRGLQEQRRDGSTESEKVNVLPIGFFRTHPAVGPNSARAAAGVGLRHGSVKNVHVRNVHDI